jgi:hypothetical protein
MHSVQVLAHGLADRTNFSRLEMLHDTTSTSSYPTHSGNLGDGVLLPPAMWWLYSSQALQVRCSADCGDWWETINLGPVPRNLAMST